MNLNQKQIAAILVIVFALALLAGCGKTTPAVSDDDPNIGLWRATKVEMFGEETDANEIFDGGFELERLCQAANVSFVQTEKRIPMHG